MNGWRTNPDREPSFSLINALHFVHFADVVSDAASTSYFT